MNNEKIYPIQFTAQGLDYLRQVLGQRPYDEAGPLIQAIEIQRREQDQPREPAPPAQGEDFQPAPFKRSRVPRAKTAHANGHDDPALP
jgi:hypothetical protein